MSTSPYLAPLRRRWYVVLLGLLATGYLAYSVTAGVAPTYTRTESVVLIPGRNTMPPGGNPFQYLGGLNQARDLLVDSLSTTASTEAVLEAAGQMTVSTVTVEANRLADAPIIVLTATAPSPAQAVDLGKALRQSLTGRLKALQDESGTPAGSRISTLVLSDESEAEAGNQSYRMLVIVTVLGVGGTLLLAALFDVALRSIRVRRGPREDQPPGEPDGESTQAVIIADERTPRGSESDVLPAGPGTSDSALDEWNVRT